MTTENPRREGLPEITPETVERLESNVFEQIDTERTERARRVKRRRGWITAAAAAALVIVGAVVSPVVLDGLNQPRGTAVSADGQTESAQDAPAQPGSEPADAAAEEGERSVISRASAVLEVPDPSVASRELTSLAEEHGGYVEGLSVGESGEEAGDADGRITLRVPAAELQTVIDALEKHGEVRGTEISTDDVTGQVIDLEARIEQAEVSVERLEKILSDTGSVSELVDAEAALAERQAELESYRSELEHLSDQVDMSALDVRLLREERAGAAPAGFGDGLSAGWGGLVAAVSGAVVAVGFLLPWMGVLAIGGAVVWGAVRLLRRRGARAA